MEQLYLYINLPHYRGGLKSISIKGQHYRTQKSRDDNNFYTITPGYDTYKNNFNYNSQFYKLI
jgi:hypothetical protein